MPEIDGQHRVAEMQRRSTDQQINEGDGEATTSLFRVKLAREERSFFGIGIHFQIAQKLRDEPLAPGTRFGGWARKMPCTNSVKPTAVRAAS